MLILSLLLACSDAPKPDSADVVDTSSEQSYVSFFPGEELMIEVTEDYDVEAFGCYGSADYLTPYEDAEGVTSCATFPSEIADSSGFRRAILLPTVDGRWHGLVFEPFGIDHGVLCMSDGVVADLFCPGITPEEVELRVWPEGR